MSSIEEISPCPITVRDAWPADISDVTMIFAEYVENTTVSLMETPPSSPQWSNRFEDITGRGLPFLIAEQAEQVIGMAYCSPWRDKSAYRFTVESSIYLKPEATGRGVGAVLLRALLDRCKKAGLREVIAVIVDPGSARSVRLHESCGYTTVGRLQGVGLKKGKVLDTILMQLRLSQR